MDFERTTRRTIRSLPLVPMIDVMFILIIFFMLTTTFMKIESLELLLPSVSANVVKKDDTLRLFIKPDGTMILGERTVSPDDLNASLARIFKEEPAARIMLLTADGVSMQQLVGVMDRVHIAGGQSLFVRRWDDTASPKPAGH